MVSNATKVPSASIFTQARGVCGYGLRHPRPVREEIPHTRAITMPDKVIDLASSVVKNGAPRLVRAKLFERPSGRRGRLPIRPLGGDAIVMEF